ncbi:MAG: DUF5668 domain-containing protein [Candidatus Aminicenantes bacterium]|nr:DUF5668 domain-containing protein [Candidatus Aminicenantes bacterium]
MAKRKDPLVWGLILVALGLVFILENFDINAWDFVWRFWPVILIIWGAAKLIEGLKRKSGESVKSEPPSPPQA